MSKSAVDVAYSAETEADKAERNVDIHERFSGLDVFKRVAFEKSDEELPTISLSNWIVWMELRVLAAEKRLEAFRLNPFTNPAQSYQLRTTRDALKIQLEKRNFPKFLKNDL